MHPVLARLMIGIELQNDTHSNMVPFLRQYGYTKAIIQQDQVKDLI
jgi:hypothetical protein